MNIEIMCQNIASNKVEQVNYSARDDSPLSKKIKNIG